MRVFNSLGRELQEFVPRQAGQVSMYVCGPTVQSSPHIGHGRSAVAFDVIGRYLEWSGYDVTYVVNITDVEDKIIAAAAERGLTPERVAAETSAQFRSAYDALNIRRPDIEPRATEHIAEMIGLIEKLIAGGHAYAADNGDVYFRVRSFADYGRLSGRKIDDLISGARIEPGEDKEDPLDFALWKAAKPGEPRWESPWGPGRPGWHIECSAMARRYLGDGFDIHGGGTDLVFPHHENEVAQSEAAHGPPFARYWLHNGMVNLGGQKMAKSTGRIVDLLGALDEYPPMAIRLFYLRTHYRRPVDFTTEALEDAGASLERLRSFRRRFSGEPEIDAAPEVLDRFRAFMEDDFDTAGALSVLFEVVREGNARLDAGQDAEEWVAAYDDIMGVLGLAEPEDSLDDLRAAIDSLAGSLDVAAAEDPAATVERIVELRDRARTEEDWARSDELRDALTHIGIIVEDAAGGTRWHRQ
ncbi:MAG: cysteine--tRNA ligase [Acidimicrobiia bacterium]|nr:cysteine--tRNA ligase [Acidimicrobiia bacterium]MBT8216503.1 cysteine--tRNA ligase [Acidimicrobiia bacterium]NNF11029.1 cysteine--tRNA ligase [Acidimicrobiia bacterium]NNL69177.1 cysteine--tRNA ligase [Acidimicrobiia bacterium]